MEQLAPAASAIRESNLSASQRRELINLYAQQMVNASGGDRQFTFAERGLVLSKEIRKLAEVVAASSLLPAYCKLLLAHLTGPRCADSAEPTDSISFFNQSLAPLGDDEATLRIDRGVAVSTVQSDRAVFEPLQFPDFRGLMRRLSLRRNLSTNRNADDDRVLDAQAVEFLDKLARLDDGQNGCKTCRFYEKASVYLPLIDLLEGSVQESAVDAFLAFLAQDPMQFESPIEWIVQVKLLMSLTRKLKDSDTELLKQMQQKGMHLNMLPNPQGQRILENARRGGSPYLATYGWAEVVVPRVFDFSRFAR